jgi:hypothetical protein
VRECCRASVYEPVAGSLGVRVCAAWPHAKAFPV